MTSSDKWEQAREVLLELVGDNPVHREFVARNILDPIRGSIELLMNKKGQELQKIRKALQVRLKDLARDAGVTNSRMCLLEKGNVSPSIKMIKTLAPLYGLGIGEFVECWEASRIATEQRKQKKS